MPPKKKSAVKPPSGADGGAPQAPVDPPPPGEGGDPGASDDDGEGAGITTLGKGFWTVMRRATLISTAAGLPQTWGGKGTTKAAQSKEILARIKEHPLFAHVADVLTATAITAATNRAFAKFGDPDTPLKGTTGLAQEDMERVEAAREVAQEQQRTVAAAKEESKAKTAADAWKNLRTRLASKWATAHMLKKVESTRLNAANAALWTMSKVPEGLWSAPGVPIVPDAAAYITIRLAE